MEPEDFTLSFYRRFFRKFKGIITQNVFLSIESPIFDLDTFESFRYSEGKNLIHEMVPILADTMRRCLPLSNILHIFNLYDSKHPDSRLKFRQISQRNLIEFLLQIVSSELKSITGSFLYQMQKCIPLSYWRYKVEDKEINYNIDLSVLYNIIPKIENKPVILNFGVDSGRSIGKTSLLAKCKLFDLAEETININDGSGIARSSTVDLYVTKNLVIIDVNDAAIDDSKFKKFFKYLVSISNAVVLHLDASSTRKQIKKDLEKLNGHFQNFKKIFTIFRDTSEKIFEKKTEFLESLHEKGFPFTENSTTFLKNLRNLNNFLLNSELIPLREKLGNWLRTLAETHKDNLISFDKLVEFNDKRDEETKQRFLDIDKFFDNLTNKRPFENILPFAAMEFAEYKIERNQILNEDETVLILPKKTFRLMDLTSKRFAVAAQNNHLEMKKFDERLRLLTSSFTFQVKRKISDLEKSLDPKSNPNNKMKEKVIELTENIANNSISANDLFAELFSFYEFKKKVKQIQDFSEEEERFFKELQLFLAFSIRNGAKLQLIRGIPLKIRNEFLKELFDLPMLNLGVSYYVVSIIGMQSSGKSTLLNYLFGCDLETSPGRCTRGIYSTIIKTPNEKVKILLLDTEGLASMENQDRSFDNRMALMCFGLSNLVLINHKGEISRNIADLLSISSHAMHYFQQLRGSLPKIFFVLRDQIFRRNQEENQEVSFNVLKTEIEKIDQKLILSKEFFFLLPSAFNEDSPNQTFGEEIVKLRMKICEQIEMKDWKKKQLRDIYSNACTLWELFENFGQKLLCCETLREYETKLNVEVKIKNIAKNEIRELAKIVNESLGKKIGKVSSIKEIECTDFDGEIKKKFKKRLEELENEEFKALKEEFEGNLRIVESGLQDLRDLFRCEEKNLVYCWEFRKKQKVKDIKLQNLETEFNQKINKKIKKLLNKKVNDSETEFEKYISEEMNTFISELEPNFIEQNEKGEDLKDVLRVFNLFKRGDLDEITTKMIRKFKNDPIDLKESEDEDLIEFQQRVDSYLKTISADSTLTSLNEEKVEKFFEFYEEILGDSQYLDMNLDFLKYHLCFSFINKVTRRIKKNKKRAHEDFAKTYKEKAEKKQKEYITLFNNRRDNLETIKNLVILYFNRNIEIKVANQKMNTSKIIEEKLEKIPIDPEKFLDYAYEESFGKIDSAAIYYYVIDINGYVVKLFKDISKKILNDVLRKMNKELDDTIHQEINTFKEECLEYLKTQNKTLHSEDLFNYIKKVFPDVDLEFDKLFDCEIPTEDMEKFLLNFDFNSCLQHLDRHSKDLEDHAKEFLQLKKQIIVGCQFRCPSCRSKCIKPAGDHDHKTHHLLNCFGGVHQMKSKEVVKYYCLETQNINRQWMHGQKIYESLKDMCKDVHPKWTEEFKKEMQQEMNNKEKEKQLKCWMYVHKPILEKYKAKDSELVGNQIVLNEANILPADYEEELLTEKIKKFFVKNAERKLIQINSANALNRVVDMEEEQRKNISLIHDKEEKWKRKFPKHQKMVESVVKAQQKKTF